jgi:RNA polymerase primary sigma factor
MVSLDAPVGEGSMFGEFVADRDALSPEAPLVDKDAIRCLAAVLQSLSERERLALELRYGIGDDCEHTLEEIGQRPWATRERVRQIEKRAMGRLRQRAREEQTRAA